jgi:DNA-binding NarL/FixJ family response regulator
MLREGLHRSLSAVGFDITGEASDGRAALELIDRTRPDVVLMDVTMPVLDGIQATKAVTERWPDTKVVVLTMHADPKLASEAIDAGAMGYLVKDCTTDDIVAAIDAALRGERTFPSAESAALDEPATPKPVITHREKEVLQLIADGRSTTEAAKLLYVSIKTVKNHLASAYGKLDAHDRTQAVLRAARLGLITLRDQD